jgi:alpha-1,6-mannosyltransferase
VATHDPSRLFGPVHVAAAVLARVLGLSAVGAYGLVAGFNLLALAFGQYLFGRAYFRSPWGPLALIVAMAAGWWVSFIHTGFHSALSLLEGAEYPATTGVALGLVLWGLTLRLAATPRWSLAYPLLVAVMTANHPLSAGIAFVGGACLGLLEPGTLQGRLRLAVMGAAGLVLAAAWPWFNPYRVLLTAGAPDWGPSIDFYSPAVLAMTLWPAALGLFGLRRSTAAMLAVYALLFLAGLFGSTVAHRFLMPVVLTLHIGVAGLLLRFWPTRWRRALITAAAASVAVQLAAGGQYVRYALTGWRTDGDLLRHARALRLNGVVAGDGLAAWPVVASGAKVIATPLPEPLIADQARRQGDNADLFDPAQPPAAKRAILARYGVHSLVVDTGLLRPGEFEALGLIAHPVATSGPLMRWEVKP